MSGEVLDVVSLVQSWNRCNVDIVDLRKKEDFIQGHIRNSGSIPYEGLLERIAELPPKGAVIQLVGEKEEVDQAKYELTQRGYVIENKIIFSQQIWDRLKEKNLTQVGCADLKPLWTASPCLSRYIEQIEAMLLESGVENLEKAIAVDLACGCGRDVVFLALRNWGRVVGIDYHGNQLERTKNLAEHHNIEDQRIEVIERDLEKDGLPLTQFPGTCHLLTIARYLYRPHFVDLIKLLAPGGFLVFHTFMKGCENSTVGRPRRPQFLLNPNELAETFNPSTGFEIIADKVDNISDGRETSFFVARRLPLSK